MDIKGAVTNNIKEATNSLNGHNIFTVTSFSSEKIMSDTMKENKNLLDYIEQLKRQHTLDIQKLKDYYENKLKEKDDIISHLNDEIFKLEDKGTIKKLLDQIQSMKSQYNDIVESYSFQNDKVFRANETIQQLLNENEILRNKLYERRERFDSFEERSVPNLEIESDNELKSSNASQRSQVSSKRRAPPDHPALANQIVFNETNRSTFPNQNYQHFSNENINSLISNLLKEKESYEQKINRVIPSYIGKNEQYKLKLQRERDEKHIEEINHNIGELRNELLRRSSK